MGRVYKAQDPFIGRPAALKTISGALVGKPEFLERFYREARSAGTLQHPNIITIYELGEDGDTPFIAMEFLEGESLEKVIERRSVLTIAQKVGFMVPVCRALDFAHKRGVVHRDIKPANVMITKDGDVKVVDFGIARLMDASHTQTNMIIGTLGYMSPQQIRGERADERSDIWAVGVMFYELLCYQRPFDGANHAALMLNIANDETQPPPLTLKQLSPDCGPALEVLVAKMLHKDIQQRYQTMEEVLFDLEPVWRRLQEAGVADLIANGEELIRAEDYTRARDVLRKALQVDSRNSRAKTLLEEVNAKLRRTQIRSQLVSLLAKTQALLEDRRYPEAEAEAETALRLDPASTVARELLIEAEAGAARARLVEQGLRAAKQRLAEGALEEAAQQAQQVLDREASNTQALALQKQIQDQIARREERNRLADILQNARRCWAEQRLDECITLLTEAQKDFPDDAQIAKLLGTAKQDRAEQQKQQKLTEAKSLLAEQRFDEALAVLESLATQHPSDSAAQKLRELVLQEKDELLRRQKLQKAIVDLQSLVNTEKFSEAVSRGEKLLKEYPAHIELSEIVNFARGEAAQLERKRNIHDALRSAERKIQDRKFKDAVAAAEKALTRFPREPGLEAIRDRAREKQKEQENRELLHQRIAEIRVKINGGQHTAAVNLAQQTLATLGPNEQVTQLLRAAEMESAQKREKQREQDRRMAAAQTLLQKGQFDDATQILRSGLETKLLSKKDPRVTRLFQEIEQLKAAAIPSTLEPVPEADTPPAKGYVFQMRPLLQQAPPAENDATIINVAAGTFSRTVIGRIDAPLDAPADAPLPPSHSDLFLQPQDAESLPPQDTEFPPFARLAEFVRQRPLPAAAGALVLVLFVVAVLYLIPSGATAQEIHLRDQARQLELTKDWPRALADYENLARLRGALANDARSQAARLQKLLDQEDSLVREAQDDADSGNPSAATQLYQQVIALHGDKEQEALGSFEKLSTQMNVNSRLQPTGGDTAAPHTKVAAAPKKSEKKTTTAQTTGNTVTPSRGEKAQTDNCQLIQSDILRYTDMADSNRARGKYVDAEREYNAVLACEPQNENARAGFLRTKQAEAVSDGSPNH
jgi:serine/threonine-protein kinase